MLIKRYKKPDDEEELLEKLKNEKLESNDIKAIIIAMVQMILPITIGIVAIYFLVILFLTKVWLR